MLGSPRGKVGVPGQTLLPLDPTLRLLIAFLIKTRPTAARDMALVPLLFFKETISFPPKCRWGWRRHILLTQTREAVSLLVQMAVPRTPAGRTVWAQWRVVHVPSCPSTPGLASWTVYPVVVVVVPFPFSRGSLGRLVINTPRCQSPRTARSLCVQGMHLQQSSSL